MEEGGAAAGEVEQWQDRDNSTTVSQRDAAAVTAEGRAPTAGSNEVGVGRFVDQMFSGLEQRLGRAGGGGGLRR